MQETIGQVIRRLRKERCMTQEEFADALGGQFILLNRKIPNIIKPL